MASADAAAGVPAAELRQAAQAVRDADALLICTGAGMGVDSGLGTFRGKNAGVWPPLRALQMDFSEMSCPSWFVSDPRLAWAFWHFRHQAYTKGQPHAGYEILAKWGSKMEHGFFSVTSNIDGHWARTVGADLTFECHGAVTHMQYVDDDGTAPWETDDAQIEALSIPEWNLAPGDVVETRNVRVSGKEHLRGLPGVMGRDPGALGGTWVPAVVAATGAVATEQGEILPVAAVRIPDGEDLCRVREGCALPCDSSGRPLRPNVLMFGDSEVNCARIDEQERRFRQWSGSLPEESKLVIVEVGAGTAIRTIRSIGESTARKFKHSTFIRINLEDSAAQSGDTKTISIGGMGALAALSQMEAVISSLEAT